MDIPEANSLAQKFDKKLIYDDDRVDEFIHRYSQSIDDELLILTSIVKLFDSLPSFSINHLILRYRVKNQLYVNLIIELVERKSNSLYQLARLWETDPDIAEYVYGELNQKNDEKFAPAMGYLLTGLAKKNSKELFRIIDD